MSQGDPASAKALADLVSVILSHGGDGRLHEQMLETGHAEEYQHAMKNALVVLGQSGALGAVEARLGVKLPADEVVKLSQKRPQGH